MMKPCCTSKACSLGRSWSVPTSKYKYTFMYSRNLLRQTVRDGEGTIVAIWSFSKFASVNSRIANLQILFLQFHNEYNYNYGQYVTHKINSCC